MVSFSKNAHIHVLHPCAELSDHMLAVYLWHTEHKEQLLIHVR